MPAFASLPPLLLVALGGGAGAVLRYLVGSWAITTFGPGFAWGTWLINLGGSFLLGLLAAYLARFAMAGEPLRLLLGVGLLGGFTTFSAFSLELVTMAGRGEAAMAAAYAVSSVAGGVVAAFLGVMLGRA